MWRMDDSLRWPLGIFHDMVVQPRVRILLVHGVQDKEVYMSHRSPGINLAGNWNISGVDLQIAFLRSWDKLESDLENQGRQCALPDSARERLDTFWNLIGAIRSAILFMMIGMEVQVMELSRGYLMAGMAAVVIALLGRQKSWSVPLYPSASRTLAASSVIENGLGM